MRRRELLFGAVWLAATAGRGWAQAAGYRFELLNPPTRTEVGVLLRVRVTNGAGAPVVSASVSSARLTRTSDIVPHEVARVSAAIDSETGVYGLRTDLNTDGAYRLEIVLRPPGAPEVPGEVTFTIAPP